MPRSYVSKKVALALAAIAAFAVGGAIAFSVTPGGQILWEDAVTLGGGTGTTPSSRFANVNHGAIVAGHGATTSGHSAFFGPNLEPFEMTVPAAVEGFNQYE